MEIGFRTDTGKVRKNNEDSFYVSKDNNIYIIADGIGGNNAGEIASKLAVDTVGDYIINMAKEIKDNEENEIKRFLSDCLYNANNKLLHKSNSNKEYFGMGTTITVLYILSRAYIAHLGDSRAYIMDKSSIKQLTQDHTLVAELYKNGTITIDEARNHPKKNIITRALGMDNMIKADTYSIEFNENEIIILCTDGVYNYIDDKEMLDIFNNNNNLQDSCDYIVSLVNNRGGNDNITIIAVKNN